MNRDAERISTAGPSDDALIAAAQRGDQAAFGEIVRRYQRAVYRVGYALTRNASDADDLAQETFVRVYQNRQSYRPSAKFSSWLFTIASNLCRNHLRWGRRHPTVSLAREDDAGDGPADATDTLPSPDRGPSDCAERNDTARWVKAEIQALPHDLKTVVLLFEYEELSYEEIADVLHCSPKAVETRLYRARKILREKLERLAWR